jgi:hypothetical protein
MRPDKLRKYFKNFYQHKNDRFGRFFKASLTWIPNKHTFKNRYNQLRETDQGLHWADKPDLYPNTDDKNVLLGVGGGGEGGSPDVVNLKMTDSDVPLGK